MREIKFRSWSEKDRKFYYFYKGLFFDCESKIENITHIGGNNFYKFNWDNAEQFIGLKDSNGVDIYEGDILRCDYWDDENYIVEYEQDDRYIGYWFPKYDEEEIKVIGNIHTQK